MSFKIITDSCCDLAELAAGLDLTVVPLSVEIDGAVYTEGDMTPKELYDHLRAGKMPKTSAVNPEEFIGIFEPILAASEDILYIGFSSGLSTTCNYIAEHHPACEVYPLHGGQEIYSYIMVAE